MVEANDASARRSQSDDRLIEAFLTASRVLVAVAARSVAISGADVTLSQYRALVVLSSRGPQRIRDLADRLGIDGSNATRACDRLQRRGLVARHRAPDDRRAVRVSATEAGADLVRATTSVRRAEIARILAAMPKEGRNQVIAALEAFAAAAYEVPEQDWSMGWSDNSTPAGSNIDDGSARRLPIGDSR